MNKLEAYVKYAGMLRKTFSGHAVILIPLVNQSVPPEPEMLRMVVYGLDRGWLKPLWPSTAHGMGVTLYGLTEKGIEFLFPKKGGQHE